ncbi:MAG: oligosaccharide flippase family protein [Pseudomonadota bacterium]
MDKPKQKKILQEATLFSTSLFISRILLSIRGIIIPKFLGPIEYGIYNGLLIIPDFLAHFHFGSLSALKREIPFCYGKKDFSQAQRIRNLVFSQYMGTILVSVFLIFFVVTFLLKDRYSTLFIHSLWLICLLIVVQSLVDAFLENLLRTDNRFDILSSSEIFKSLVGFSIMLVLIWFWHLYGLIASMILAAALKGAYIYHKTNYEFAWVWDFKELKRLLGIGFPIIFGVILITFFTSLDRIMIINFLDVRQLGYYALGLTFSKFLLIIQTGAYGVLEPKVYRLYGEKGEIGALKKIVWEPLYGMSLFFPLVIGLAYIGVPYLIHLFLPKYLPSMICTKIMILGSFFFIYTEGAYTFIVAINRQGLIVKVTALGILLNLILNYCLIRQGWGIEGVAFGTVGTNMIMGVIYLNFTLNHFIKGWWERTIMFCQLFFPVVLVGGLLISMDTLWPVQGVLSAEIGYIALKTICLLIFLTPFFWKLKKSLKRLGDFFE